jgi:hypothetical protein
MKRSVLIAVVLSILALGGLVALAHGAGRESVREPYRGGRAVSAATLPADVQEALLETLTGPEGEYAAYASYAAVIEKYGDVEPYLHIMEAEGRHITALQRQLDKYGIAYPAENSYIGQIEAPESLLEAAQAWAEGEIANVEMYEQLLSVVEEYPDITRVFLNLQRASQEAHLPAFESAAQNGGTRAPGEEHDCGSSSQGGRSRRL